VRKKKKKINLKIKKHENIRTFFCFLIWKFFTLKLQELVELRKSLIKCTKLEYIILTCSMVTNTIVKDAKWFQIQPLIFTPA